MKKKIICMVMVLAMLFSLCGCSKVDNLEQDRATAIMNIETYAEDKGQDNYSEENWLRIEEIVSNGKSDILSSQSTAEIEDIITSIKQEIDGVLVEPPGIDYDVMPEITTEMMNAVVDFLGLGSAYAQEYISKEDLIVISALLNNLESLPLESIPINDLGVIKLNYFKYTGVHYDKLGVINYGKYNGNYAIMVYEKSKEASKVERQEIIDGVTFNYYNDLEIIVFKIYSNEDNSNAYPETPPEPMPEITPEIENATISFFRLGTAYAQGYVTKEDLTEIANLNNNSQELPLGDIPKNDLAVIKLNYSQSLGIPYEWVGIRYYGKYNGYYAMVLSEKYSLSAAVIWQETIAGVRFNYPSMDYRIVVCIIDY